MDPLENNPNVEIVSQENPWKPIISIDPGKNLGYAIGVYRKKENKIIVKLIKSKCGSKQLCNDEEWDNVVVHKSLLSRMAKSFMHTFCDEFKMKLGITTFISERQYYNPKDSGAIVQAIKLNLCEQAFSTVFHCNGAFVTSVNPAQSKSAFSCNTGNYAENKKLVQVFVNDLLIEGQSTSHHCADAILNIYYHFKIARLGWPGYETEISIVDKEMKDFISECL
jgi:hypothetical protein